MERKNKPKHIYYEHVQPRFSDGMSPKDLEGLAIFKEMGLEIISATVKDGKPNIDLRKPLQSQEEKKSE